MDLFTAIKERRSIRKFLDQPVPQEDINEIIEAARWAPSSSNRQMWKFIVIKNKQVLDEMAQAICAKVDQIIDQSGYTQLKAVKSYATFFKEAPVTIAVFLEPHEGNLMEEALKALEYTPEQVQRLRGQVAYQSIGAAVENILLAAHGKGYGACWLCGSNIAAPEIEKILGVAGELELKALIPLGKAAVVPKRSSRKELSQIMTVIE